MTASTNKVRTHQQTCFSRISSVLDSTQNLGPSFTAIAVILEPKGGDNGIRVRISADDMRCVREEKPNL